MNTTLTRSQLLNLPAVVDIVTAGRAFGLGRTKTYELAQRGDFPCRVLRVGTSYRVAAADLLAALGITPEQPQPPEPPGTHHTALADTADR